MKDKPQTDRVRTDIQDRGDMLTKFVEEIGFFVQYPEMSRSQVIFWVFLALPREVDNWLTRKDLAEYLGVTDETLVNRKYRLDVARVQKAACMQFLQSNSTTEVLNYMKLMATGQTEFNPAPAMKLYLQFIEARSEKIGVESEWPVTIVFGGGGSHFVRKEEEEDEDEDTKPKKKGKWVAKVKITDTEKGGTWERVKRLSWSRNLTWKPKGK